MKIRPNRRGAIPTGEEILHVYCHVRLNSGQLTHLFRKLGIEAWHDQKIEEIIPESYTGSMWIVVL